MPSLYAAPARALTALKWNKLLKLLNVYNRMRKNISRSKRPRKKKCRLGRKIFDVKKAEEKKTRVRIIHGEEDVKYIK